MALGAWLTVRSLAFGLQNLKVDDSLGEMLFSQEPIRKTSAIQTSAEKVETVYAFVIMEAIGTIATSRTESVADYSQCK